jgi:hypothetical protein
MSVGGFAPALPRHFNRPFRSMAYTSKRLGAVNPGAGCPAERITTARTAEEREMPIGAVVRGEVSDSPSASLVRQLKGVFPV